VTDTPLARVRVLEIGAFIAGPFAGQLLGDLGADVVKIEPPGSGDIMRRYGVCVDGRSLWWPHIARNKRSVAIDLRDARGRDLARRIAERCDVVLENFKPGTLAGFGLDYATLARANPGIVLVHVSGFGQSGPRSAEPGFGSIISTEGNLIVLSDKGELLIFGKDSPGPDSELSLGLISRPEPVARAKVLSGTCWTPPSLADGRLYVRNAKGEVRCVDLSWQ